MKSELDYMYIKVPDYLWFGMKGVLLMRGTFTTAQLNTSQFYFEIVFIN